ncbi:T-lymphocyte surface antigen Ly-9 isoform X4 [Kogia breviceps]|uniref:T-lymphocyte surface antigen Ly-9 isoform X4 n=1 Tax=Kogia breviceps TaxID=27615 RepID=UPI0034D153D2
MASPRRQTDGWALQTFSNEPPKRQPHIFSPFLWTPLLFLLMGLGASEKDSAPTVVKGILGGSVILSLNISVDTEIEHIVWSGPQVALALADARGKIIFIDKSYQGRINVTQNNSLSINKLTLKDAGSYKAQINQKNSEVTTSEKFTLSIYEQLQEPRVTMKSVNMSENTSCNITLVCSVKGAGEDVQYYWTSRDPHASESWRGPSLTISWLPCDPDLPYICRAKNPVSQSSSSPVHAWQFCTDLGASRGGPMGEAVAGILGESITLSLALPDSQHIDNVVWMFNTSIISKEWGEEATANQLIKFKDPNQNTAWVSSQDYSLKIGQLKMEDAGPYHAYVCSNARVASTKHINLSIYRRLKKPKVTGSLGLTEDGVCRVSLTCSVEDIEHNVTYRWSPLPKGAVVSQGGAHLSVSWRSGEKHPSFTCRASNPVQPQPSVPVKLRLQLTHQGMGSSTLSLRLPGTSPTAALTATEQLRRMRRGQRCTNPSMEETRCVIWSLRRMLDMTRTLRGKQSMISSLQMTRHRHLRLKGKLCIHRCSLTFRDRPQFLRRKRGHPQSTALYRNLRRWYQHRNRMISSLLKYLPMKMSPEKQLPPSMRLECWTS